MKHRISADIAVVRDDLGSTEWGWRLSNGILTPTKINNDNDNNNHKKNTPPPKRKHPSLPPIFFYFVFKNCKS